MIVNLGISNAPWEIYEVESSNSLLLVDGKRCRGATHYYMNKIVLDKDMSLSDKESCLRHELTHAILYLTQAIVPEDDKYTEEQLCEFVGIYGGYINSIVDIYSKSEWELPSKK